LNRRSNEVFILVLKIGQFAQKITPVLTTLLLSVGITGIAQAATFTERGDAGPFPSWSAQTVNLAPGETLDEIKGSFNSGIPTADVDIFKISLSAGNFFARTEDGNTAGDRSLFLFDENGLGLAANRGNGFEVALEGLISTAGDYFLGIGNGQNYSWNSSQGRIFTANDYATTAFGASGPGASERPWSVSRSNVRRGDFDYTIAISQTPTTAVPEPGMLMGLGLLGIFGITKMRHQQS
jgi:hypothetical protein